DLVAEETGFHPADDQEIGRRHERAVEDPVLRAAEATGAIADRDLDHAEAAHAKERGNEPVKAAVERQIAQAFPAKRAVRTAAVVDGLVADPVADAVGQP